MTTQRLSHHARRERRQLIAEAVKRSTDPSRQAAVARAFGVTVSTVSTACAEFGVMLDQTTAAPRTFDILAALLRGARPIDVARHFGVSRQRIDQIRNQAEIAGIFELVKR